jgi:arsenite-transporting ATPase
MAETKLFLFTGKGGVGKTTVSCSTAVDFASKNIKTILVSSDPAHSTDDVLGVKIGSEATKIKENLWAMNLNAEAKAKKFTETIADQLSHLVDKIPGFDAEILEDMAGFPGMDEYFAMDAVHRLLTDGEYDVVVFDTAPTGHTLKMLTAPDSIRSFILRILRMRAKIENIKGFLFRKKSETEKVVKELELICDRIDEYKVLMRSNRCSLNLISIPSEAGYQECARTINFMKDIGFYVEHIIVNQIVPDFGTEIWRTASDNPAAAMTFRQYTIQQPYLERYKLLASRYQTRLVGLSLTPYEPIGFEAGLPKFAEILCGPKGIKTGVLKP